MKESILWRCNFCGGLAHWCFIDDELHYHCQRECGAFMQRSLFEPDEFAKVVECDSASALTGGQATRAELVDRFSERGLSSEIPF